MKIRQLLAILGLGLLTQTASADIMLSHFSFAPDQSCSNFAGRWNGVGTIKAKIIFPIVCHYKGVADVVVSDNNPNAFTVRVDMTKADGVCPDHEVIQLPGTCENGAIRLQTSRANLHGNINDAGTEASLAGSIIFDVMGKDVNADVEDMQLHRQ